jgi:hypothetical protein
MKPRPAKPAGPSCWTHPTRSHNAWSDRQSTKRSPTARRSGAQTTTTFLIRQKHRARFAPKRVDSMPDVATDYAIASVQAPSPGLATAHRWTAARPRFRSPASARQSPAPYPQVAEARRDRNERRGPEIRQLGYGVEPARRLPSRTVRRCGLSPDPEAGAGGDCRRWPSDGADDPAAVDALQANARDAKVRVPKLPLDRDQRDTFMRHLTRVDGLGVASGSTVWLHGLSYGMF